MQHLETGGYTVDPANNLNPTSPFNIPTPTLGLSFYYPILGPIVFQPDI